MKKKKRLLLEHIGIWAFIGGMLTAILISGSSLSQYNSVRVVLAVLGTIVGILNITDVEVDRFLLSAIALIVLAYIISAVFDGIPFLGVVLQNMYENFISFVGPAAAVVTVKVLLDVASER